jgi:hypothetical protein
MSGDEFERELPEAMKRVVDEARDGAPRVDWAKLEARLFDDEGELREELRATPSAALAPPVAAPPGRRFLLVGALGLAAAAAIAGFFALPRETPKAPVATASATTNAAPTVANALLVRPARAAMLSLGSGHEARELHVGDVIDVASRDGEWIQSAGRLKAHALPGSKLRLLDDGERMRFALESGEITADVTPVPGGEPYAIDVDGRRVAVHGTRLSIRRVAGADGSSVEVSVAEGLAAIGYPGDGRTTGPEVSAGMIGRFVGAGAPELRTDPIEAARRVSVGLASSTLSPAPTTAALLPTSLGTSTARPTGEPFATRPAPNAPNAPETSASVAVSASATEPTGLGARDYGPPLWNLQQAVKSCVPHTAAGVSVSIEETMTLTVTPAGDIGSLTFDPPLSPELEACVRNAQKPIKFPVATGPTTLKRDVTLGTAR